MLIIFSKFNSKIYLKSLFRIPASRDSTTALDELVFYLNSITWNRQIKFELTKWDVKKKLSNALLVPVVGIFASQLGGIYVLF